MSDWSSDVCSSDLAEGAGIKAQTIASFVLAHERFIAERSTPRYETARVNFAGTMLVVDETSMVSSNDMLKLHRISPALGVDKPVLVGDRQQTSSNDAGKAFAMRSEERRVGKACGRTGRSRWSPSLKKKTAT